MTIISKIYGLWVMEAENIAGTYKIDGKSKK